MTAECDAMHGALMRRADALEGCAEGSDEEAELRAIVDAIEAYESGPLANWQGAGRERVGGLGAGKTTVSQYYLTQSIRHRQFPVPMVPRRALPLGAARSLGRLVSRKAPLLFDQLAREDALVSSGWTDRTGKSIDADTITGSWRRAPPARE